MAFVSWATELARFKDSVANRNVDHFWLMSTENSREMKAVYTRLDNIQSFIEWLEMKAAEELQGSAGDLFISIGGE